MNRARAMVNTQCTFFSNTWRTENQQRGLQIQLCFNSATAIYALFSQLSHENYPYLSLMLVWTPEGLHLCFRGSFRHKHTLYLRRRRISLYSLGSLGCSIHGTNIRQISRTETHFIIDYIRESLKDTKRLSDSQLVEVDMPF